MLGIFFVMFASAVWALDTLIRYPLLFGGVSASRIVFTEHLFLFLLFAPVFFKSIEKIKKAPKRHYIYFFIVGGLGSAIATLSFTRAFGLINPSLVILLQKLQPVIAVLLARLLIGEHLSKKFVLFGMLGLFGGVLVSYQDIFPGLAQISFDGSLASGKNLLGYALTLVAVIGWGSATVFGKKLSLAGYTEKELMSGRFTMGLICLLPILIGPGIEFDLNLMTWGKIGLMALMSGLISMYLFYQGLKRISARVCTLAEMTFPFMAVTINWIFLDAKLTAMQIIGGILLIISSTIIQLKKY